MSRALWSGGRWKNRTERLALRRGQGPRTKVCRLTSVRGVKKRRARSTLRICLMTIAWHLLHRSRGGRKTAFSPSGTKTRARITSYGRPRKSADDSAPKRNPSSAPFGANPVSVPWPRTIVQSLRPDTSTKHTHASRNVRARSLSPSRRFASREPHAATFLPS